MGSHFPLGRWLGRFWFSALSVFQDYTVSLSLILICENFINLGVLKRFFFVFSHFYFFSYSFATSTHFFLSCGFSAGLCAIRIRAALWHLGHSEALWAQTLACGHCSSLKGSKRLLGLLMKLSKGCFPQAVSSQSLVLTNIFPFVCTLPSCRAGHLPLLCTIVLSPHRPVACLNVCWQASLGVHPST